MTTCTHQGHSLSPAHCNRIARACHRPAYTALQYATRMIQDHVTFYGRPDVNAAREEVLENVRIEAGHGREDRTEFWVQVLGQVDELVAQHLVPKDLRGD